MKAAKWVCVFCVVIFATACAQKKYLFEYKGAESSVVWPEPPEKPRIRFLGNISGEQNFKVDESSLTVFNKGIDWLKNFVFGESALRGLHRPQGVFLDSSNSRLYVTDIGRKAVFVFDFVTNQLQVWDQIDELNKFSSPIAVAKNTRDEVFVADSGLGYVAKFDVAGEPLEKWGQNVLKRPTGLAFDYESKHLYVSDAALHKIFVFTDKGELAFQIGSEKGEAPGRFNSPTYLTITNQELIVSDTLNARVQIFSLQGALLRSFGRRGMFKGNLPRPKGVATDSDNHIYVIESYYDHLLVFDDKGTPLLPIGGNGFKPGKFNLPAGMWIDTQDRIYIADMFNSRISVFQYIKQNRKN